MKITIYRMSFEDFYKKYKERLMKLERPLKALNGKDFDVIQEAYHEYFIHPIYGDEYAEYVVQSLEQYIEELSFLMQETYEEER